MPGFAVVSVNTLELNASVGVAAAVAVASSGAILVAQRGTTAVASFEDASGSQRTVTVIWPESVNLNAFDRRFTST